MMGSVALAARFLEQLILAGVPGGGFFTR